MAIEIRPHVSKDDDGVAELILPIQRDEFQIPITLEQQPDLLDIDGFYRTGAGEFWVAADGDLIAGSIALIDIGDQRGVIRKMFVHRDYRGGKNGVAGRLLTTLLDHARRAGIEALYLGTTDKFLAAHRFYEKNGFSVLDEIELPDSFPRMAVDTRFYKCVL